MASNYSYIYENVKTVLRYIEDRLVTVNNLSSLQKDNSKSFIGVRESLIFIDKHGKRGFRNHLAKGINRIEKLSKILKADNLNNIDLIFADDEAEDTYVSSKLSKASLEDIDDTIPDIKIIRENSGDQAANLSSMVEHPFETSPIRYQIDQDTFRFIPSHPASQNLIMRSPIKHLSQQEKFLFIRNETNPSVVLVKPKVLSKSMTISQKTIYPKPVRHMNEDQKVHRSSSQMENLIKHQTKSVNFHDDQDIFEQIYHNVINLAERSTLSVQNKPKHTNDVIYEPNCNIALKKIRQIFMISKTAV